MELKVATKSDKKSIKRFYKQQQYPGSFMGNDTCYIAMHDGQLIGCAIVSELEGVRFLHALVIEVTYRNQGIASRLLKMLSKHPPIICFADISLSHLYLSNNFKQISMESLPLPLAKRYSSYKQKKSDLAIYCHG